MKKRKGNLLHRMMALLLSAVLTAGTVLGTAPLNVLAQENAGEGYNQAQESVSGNAVTEEETGAESDGEEMEAEPAEGESEKPVENLATEETGGETDGQPDEAAAPQKVMRTAGVAAQADVDVSGEGWTIDVDGKLTIESDEGMVAWENHEDHSTNRKKIKTVELLDGVTKIVFNSFSEASSLAAITIPSSVIEIERFTFVGDALTNITIPAGVTSIGNSAFFNCSVLESVTVLGENPATIGTGIFERCKFVTDKTKGIKVPAGTAEAYQNAWTEWADYITDGTEDLFDYGKGWTLDNNGKLTIESDEGMKDWRDFKAQNGRNEKVISAEIKDGVTSIPTVAYNGAFSNCSNMTSITIPSSVINIGERAFEECSKLTDITIPDSVTAIGEFAFMGCSELEDITIPDSVTSIGKYMFHGCSKLRRVTLPSNMASIEDGMFRGCNGLTDISIPSNVTSIGAWAFRDCSALTSITLPSGVTEIKYGAFSGCSGLTDIVIPDSVTDIGHWAFKDCSALQSVTMQGSEPPTLGTTLSEGTKEHFTGCGFVTDGAKGIKVPAGTASAYKTAWPEWENYITEGSASEGEIIASGTDWTLDSNGKLTIESAEGMHDWENYGRNSHAEKVISVEIEMNEESPITSIKSDAFRECANMESITIPNSVVSIANRAFWPCTSLKEITIPSSVTSIGEGAFSDCSALTSITLPSGVTDIEDSTFSGCSSLTNIMIPSGVTSIGAWAFRDCSALTSITLPSGVAEIKYGAFSDCSGLTDIVIPDSVTDIGFRAFRNCGSLQSVIMEGSTPPTLGASSDGTIKDHFAGCGFVTADAKGIKVPAGTASAYKTAWPEWEDYIAEGSAPAAPTDQEKVEAAKKAVEDALAGIHMSNATTKERLEADLKAAIKTALEEAGIDSKDVAISVENFSKTKATTDTTGNISADVRITSGTASATVPASQTINQLPGTPADKVAAVRTALEDAVKKALDEALAGTKVTNDNAEEIAAQIAGLIPEAVAEALEAAGVGADEITIGEVDIAIEPATADREGSIKVVIPVTSTEDAGQSGSASIQVPVTKPGGEEDPDKEAEEVQKAVEDALKNITITNDTTPEDIRAALQEALGNDVTVEDVEELEKVDATQDAPGKLTLKIKVIINGKTIYVTVNVPIEQLGSKTGVYVRFTDYYDMDGSTPLYKYTGLAVRPAVEVYHNETLLTLGKDYTIGYKNNIKVGSAASLTVKGKGSFAGTSNAVNFTIINADIDQDTDHPTEMTVIVNTKVAPVIMNGTKKLTTKDYQLEGEGLVNGKYASATAEGTPNILTVKGINNYAGSSFTVKVTVVEKKAAGKLAVKVDNNFKPVYDGNAINLSALFKQTQDGEGAITVTDSKEKTKILKEGTDFTVVCTSSLVNAGTVKFTLTGMGAYTGSVSKTFKISPLKVTDSSKFSVTFDEKGYEYKASGVTVDNLMVKYLGGTESAEDDKVLIQGVDYKVTYSNNKKVSTSRDAGLKVTFLGNYKGSSAVSGTFKVVTAKLSARNTVVTVPDKVYSKANKAYKSTPIVTVDGVTIKASNYTVSYAWAPGSEAEDDTKYTADNKVKITIADDTWAKVKVTVTPKENGSYGLAEGAVLEGAYYVRKTDNATNLSKAKVTFYNKAGTQLKTLEYNGSTFYTPAGNNAEADNAPDDANAVYVRATVGGAVVDPALYDVTWTNATAKGKATVVIRGKGTATDKGMAVGSKNQAINIKAMTLKGRTLKSYVENIANAMNSLKDIFFNRQ